jgi:hypothetical protein
MDAIPTSRSRLATALSIASTQRRSKYPVPTRFTSSPVTGNGRRTMRPLVFTQNSNIKEGRDTQHCSENHTHLLPLYPCSRLHRHTHPICTLSFQHTRKPCDSNCRTACRTRADAEAHLEANHCVLGACCEACGDLKYGCRELSNATSGGPKPAGLAC